MDKIVDVILDSVSTALGERVKEQVQKQKLNKLSIALKDMIQKDYIAKYENEKYFTQLDGFLEANKFYDKLVRNIFLIESDSSKTTLSNEYADKFITEYSEFQPFVQQIKSVVLELAKSVYTIIFDSKFLDGNVAYNIAQREQTIGMLENQSVMLERIEEIAQRQSNFESFTYNLYKNEKKKNDKEAYKGLHKILCDESCSCFEKEIAYIKWISEHGDLKEGLVYIASNCEKNKELERAKKYYEYILGEYEKEEYELYNNLGIIELRQNQKEAAIKWFEKVLEYDKNNINALYNLAIAHHTYGKICDVSLTFIEKAFKIDSQDADVVSFYAAVLLEKDIKNCEYAFKILNNALKSNPDNYYLNINLGFVYLFQKNFADGINLLEKLNQDYPNNIECVSLLGMMYAMIGVENAEKAIPLFEQAYHITKEEGYLENIRLLERGWFFDSVMYNYKRYEIYSDEELMLYNKSKCRSQSNLYLLY